MPLRRIEARLKEAMGLNASSIGSSAIQRAVQERMNKLRLKDMARYATLLNGNKAELSELIELVVIPETWFFRDMHPFTALTETLRKQYRHDSKPALTILSIPCSSGEEPYTIVMALDQAGFSLDSIQVDGVDISARNIGLAERAQYSNNSFRGERLEYREKYFQKAHNGFHLKPNIRSRVNFSQDNVLAAGFAKRRPGYDVIFCRNLLIYFDRETQTRVVDKLESLLKPHGLLFLGHAETGVLNGRPFESLPQPRCFGFRRISEAANMDPRPSLSDHPRQRRRTVPATKAAPAKTPWSHFFDHPTRSDTSSSSERLDTPNTQPDFPKIILQAEQLANEGHLVEAVALCESYIDQTGYDAKVCYLLGLIREAAGENAQASDFLRKAIYLDPGHVEAMIHLSLILTKLGNLQEAKRVRERAARTEQRRAGEA